MQIILLLLSFFSTKTYIIDANTNYLKTNIIINKTDINNDGIASATFNLYKDNIKLHKKVEYIILFPPLLCNTICDYALKS